MTGRIISILSLIAILCTSASYADESLRRNISLPPGFSISTYADNVPNAR